ncbi:MAG: hypothetical protein ACWA44_06450 [Thiotrichales bacterium]
MRKLLSFLLLPLLFLISACAPHVAGLQHDESFNHPSLAQGGIVVAGVSATFKTLPPEQENQMAEQFRRAIVDARKDYRVISAGQLQQHLGAERYHSLIEHFKASGVLSPADLAALKKSALPAQYILMSRLEDFSTRENREETPIFDDKGKPTDRVTVELQSIGAATGFANIYDIHKGASVWSGSITQEVTNTSSFTSYAGTNFKKSLEDAAASLILGNKATGREYPEPPPMEKVAKKIFQGFAANLPKKK